MKGVDDLGWINEGEEEVLWAGWMISRSNSHDMY